jgi:hypothetical protein
MLKPWRCQKIHIIHCLLIILEIEPTHENYLEAIFEEHSMNENVTIFVWALVEGVNHYYWLREPLNVLFQKQQSFYVTDSMPRIFDFLQL